MIKLNLVLLALLATSTAARSETCSEVDAPDARLACYDKQFQPKPAVDSGAYKDVTIVDVMVAPDDFKGTKVKISGFLMLLGQTALLAKAQFDMQVLSTDISKLPKSVRKGIFENCASGCEATVEGEISEVMFQPGIIAERITF